MARSRFNARITNMKATLHPSFSQNAATLLNATGNTAAGLLTDKWLVKFEKK